MAEPAERLREFKQYLAGNGITYEDVAKDQSNLRAWSLAFDQHKVLLSQTPSPQAGKY